MIAHLRGSLIDKGIDTVIIEAGGVGYRVSVTAGTMAGLPPVGREARLHVHTHATQDGPLQLFGFAEADERGLFETLLAVQGVGPKVALAILSGIPAADLVRAIARGDVARLTQIKGVGRKTAERMSVELRDRVGAIGAGGAAGARDAGSSIPHGKLGDVYGALMALGYRAQEFESIVANLDPGESTADLVKKTLSAMRRK